MLEHIQKERLMTKSLRAGRGKCLICAGDVGNGTDKAIQSI